MEYVIDSSILLALRRSHDSQHEKAKMLIKSIDQCILLDIVVNETLTVLKQKESLEVSQQCYNLMTGSIFFQWEYVSRQLSQQSINYMMTTANKLSFVDSALLIYARQNNIQLLTFDQELIRVYQS